MRKLALMLVLILLINFSVFGVRVQKVKASGTICIRADGSIDPPSANITTLDNVTYYFTDNNYESVVVERGNIVIDGNDFTLQGNGDYAGFTLSVDNVTVRRTQIDNFVTGIWLMNSSYSTISGNKITNFLLAGIRVSGFLREPPPFRKLSSDNKICENIIANSSPGFTGCGIYLDGSPNNHLFCNEIVKNYEGIEVSGPLSTNNIIFRNNITASEYTGIVLLGSSDCDIFENNITENYPFGWGMYVRGPLSITSQASNHQIYNNKILNNLIGIQLESTTENIICGNQISASQVNALYLGNSPNNTICRNNITNNYVGIRLDGSSQNVICRNNVSRSETGIFVESSLNNRFCKNNIGSNNVGIRLKFSSNNTLYHNNFIRNDNDASSTSPNFWDNGYPSGGNYWSDYNGTDLYMGLYQNETGNDGIGDTHYIIDDNNTDNYPLMNPWEPTSGILCILKPLNSSVTWGFVNITFAIQNRGDLMTFLAEDSSNRIDLELEYRNADGNGWGITLWSTSNHGLVLHSSERITFTMLYDPVEYEEHVPMNFTGDAPYGEATIRLVHWKQVDEGVFDYGEFGIVEIKTIITLLEDLNVDGKVDIKDIATATLAFGAFPGHERWNPQADINKDHTVDIKDIALIAKNFGKAWT